MTEKTKIVMFNPRGSLKIPYDGPPMALLVACSCLDLKKYNIKIIDWHYPDYEKRLIKECKNATIFGVTCLSGYQIKGMLESVKLVKKINPNIKVVCGGWHPTFMPEQTLECRYIDYIVMGQGQRTFKNLIECIEKRKEPKNLKGVAYRDEDNQVKVNETPLPEPISTFPPTPYHLLEDNEFFFTSTKFGERVAFLLTSIGCPFNCGFCSEAGFYKRRWSGRSPDNIIKEVLEFKNKYNIDAVIISDSNFFVSEERVAEFCKKMAKIGVKWGGTSARADSLARYSEETWKLMKKSGLKGILIGTESANNETLKLMNKGCKIEDSLKAIEMATKHGLEMECPLIIGFPGIDIEKDFKINMKFVNDQLGKVNQFHMYVYTPYPGTGLLKKAIEHGYKLPKNLEGWINYSLHTKITPWIPEKYVEITDQLSVYFQFLAGNVRKVIKATIPKPLQGVMLISERILYKLSYLRVKNSFFRFPIEYRIIKFLALHRDLLLGNKKLVY